MTRPTSDPALAALKTRLRREAASLRDLLGERADRSTVIRQRVVALPAYQAAAAIHCFLSIRSEVETRPLVAAALAAGKAVAVPVMGDDGVMAHSWIDRLDDAAFAPAPLGTLRPTLLRPAHPGDWALTIVPLLAFDRAGYRLGYGKGHYDQLLARAPGLAVGVAFACQELLELPHEPHDVPLDLIITEAELIVPARM